MGFQPERVERVGESALRVRWAGGHDSIYPWPLLRAACPCAACRETAPLEPDPAVKALEIKPVGHYALAIRWSDGHATGIFSLEYLRSLCPCEACKPEQLMEG